MPDAHIINLDSHAQQVLRYSAPNRTFKLATDRIVAAALAPIAPVVEDFLEVACAIFFADSSFARGKPNRPEMGAGWRRTFEITVPVQVLDRWSDPAVVSALTDLAGFLTEDTFIFKFVARDPHHGRQGVLNLDPAGASFEAAEVIMFSGGLDSFAGALEALSTTQGNVVLVSHRSAPKVMPRQDHLAAYLMERFPNRLKHVKVEVHRIGKQARDTSQRSRTLLFAALGQAVAQSFGARKLSFYENGIVSQNLPISPQVVGTMATRTTHPLALHKLNQLFGLLRPDAPPISNGYAWLTKTEVVQRIAQYGAADQIRRSVSCTSVFDQTTRHPHCGACSQCLDRRFGILAAGLGQEDPAEGYKNDVVFGPRDERAATMAVEWSRHALRMTKLSEMDLFRHFGSELSAIITGHPDLLPEHCLQLTLSMQQRHSEAVRSVLTAAIRDFATQITNGDVASSSLLMMHIGSISANPALSLPPDPRSAEERASLPSHIPRKDFRPDTSGPLKVAFIKVGDRHSLSVKGLCDIHGLPAKIAHGLKPMFDEDRRDGCHPDHHRYLRDHRTMGLGLSNEAFRKNVQHCRQTLAISYQELFGTQPPKPLLIQNKQGRGYRLDPTIELTNNRELQQKSP